MTTLNKSLDSDESTETTVEFSNRFEVENFIFLLQSLQCSNSDKIVAFFVTQSTSAYENFFSYISFEMTLGWYNSVKTNFEGYLK